MIERGAEKGVRGKIVPWNRKTGLLEVKAQLKLKLQSHLEQKNWVAGSQSTTGSRKCEERRAEQICW